jgi:glycerophosphoryl diester phosphodiesterase
MWFDLPKPAIIGHRGSPVYAPENTLASFEAAIRQGADAIEFDVNLTADNRVIVIHDSRVERTTNGRGFVSRLPLDVIRTLDAGSWFLDQFQGEKIPTLEEVFEWMGHRIFMNIELKKYSPPGDKLIDEVVAIVKKFNIQERILFSSFYSANLLKAKQLLPEVPCGLLVRAGVLGRTALNSGLQNPEYDAIHPHLRDVNPELINRSHEMGKKVNVWTVNRQEDIKKICGWGVDTFFTDDVSSAKKILGRSEGVI